MRSHYVLVPADFAQEDGRRCHRWCSFGPFASAHRPLIVLCRLRCLAYPRCGRGSGKSDLCVDQDIRFKTKTLMELRFFDANF